MEEKEDNDDLLFLCHSTTGGETMMTTMSPERQVIPSATAFWSLLWTQRYSIWNVNWTVLSFHVIFHICILLYLYTFYMSYIYCPNIKSKYLGQLRIALVFNLIYVIIDVKWFTSHYIPPQFKFSHKSVCVPIVADIKYIGYHRPNTIHILYVHYNIFI